MKILSIGGNFPITALRDQGHDVMAFATGFPCPHPLNFFTDFYLEPQILKGKILEVIAQFRPDWLLQVDDSSPLVHFGLEDISIPKAWYVIDTHIHREWHPHYAALFDIVFCAQKNQLEAIRKYQSNVHWLPTFYQGVPEFLDWRSRTHPVSFVGTLDATTNPRRIRLLNNLRDLGCVVNIKQGDYQLVYRDSQIVINQSSADDLNFRFFETMGCGSLLITDRISHSLHDLGEPGHDFLVYEPDNAVDLFNKIRWVQDHLQESEEIARRGYNLVLTRHLGAHRAEQIISALLKNGSTVVRLRSDILAQLAWVFGHLSRLNFPEFLVHFFTDEARRLAKAGEEISGGNPWTSIVLTRLALDAGDPELASMHFNKMAMTPCDPVLRKPYLFFQALFYAHKGDFLNAKQKLVMGIKDFPHDAELQQLYDFLKSKDTVS